MTQKRLIGDLIWLLEPTYDSSLRFVPRHRALSYFRGIFELTKLDFGVSKANLMSKRPILGDFFAEIDYLRTTLPFRIPVWPIFMIYVVAIVP